ncbi:acyl-CoA thioester hydrolase [Salinimicrobium catena]|uniref:Acyl-CoA thioester hydrolase n=1 Tax=Salinimicrobium catena TaxID=390640 RepID=A0A1H5KZA4_9FLAO|nr:thioesterase family protein [Salinimicrobium catena]SDL03699.1 acyl-CoA thioester hydrolase [Salinimicrobium catena]SEE70126.1 acyl-CoA thioester hydrolase [Salinimicrobium catena]
MKSHNSYVKVRYAETDQMGVVYHGNYAQYLEIARIDWLDAIGISYKKMEEEGVMLPVYELKTRFKRSAKFDDLLKIETTLLKKPGVRIEFSYKIFNENKELLTEAETTLIFMDMKKNKPIKCPQYILEKLGY